MTKGTAEGTKLRILQWGNYLQLPVASNAIIKDLAREEKEDEKERGRWRQRSKPCMPDPGLWAAWGQERWRPEFFP
jgi:hypothetical protein